MSTSTILIGIAAGLGLLACTGGTNPQSTSSSSVAPPRAEAERPPAVAGEAADDDGRNYDAMTVETIRGRVVAVERIQPGGGRSGGVHLRMTTGGGGEISVHLGPAWFLDAESLTVQVGDTLEVTGSRVTYGGAPALIARSVVKGDRTLVLRDDTGVPRWSGRGRRWRP